MSELIARTGRVQSWMDDPTSRLPVSCTVYVCTNQMEGKDGIEASWRFVSHALRYGAGVAVHLSQLDPQGFVRPSGVTASGPVSFAKIYSTLNEILRRGGIYKNGAVVCHLDLEHSDALHFIRTQRAELPWVKRCINITPESWEACDFKEELLYGIRSGDIWLAKKKYDKNGERIYANVCLEVFLKSRGTCLLEHVNLASCTVNDIPSAFVSGMQELCSLHSKTGVGETGEYLDPSVDRQVGLGMLGLANLLEYYGISYELFGDALERVNAGKPEGRAQDALASAIRDGVEAAAAVAKNHNMVRAFAIAPTASCSYRSKSIEGHTACPEIAPPIARSVDRDSGTFGVQTYEYGDVEIASDVGWAAYKKVADQIMIMLEKTGLLHGYSFNSWSDIVTYDNAFIEEWLESPQTSLYYSLQVMGDVQDKSDAMAALSGAEIDDYLSHMLMEATNEPQCDCQE